MTRRLMNRKNREGVTADVGGEESNQTPEEI